MAILVDGLHDQYIVHANSSEDADKVIQLLEKLKNLFQKIEPKGDFDREKLGYVFTPRVVETELSESLFPGHTSISDSLNLRSKLAKALHIESRTNLKDILGIDGKIEFVGENGILIHIDTDCYHLTKDQGDDEGNYNYYKNKEHEDIKNPNTKVKLSQEDIEILEQFINNLKSLNTSLEQMD